MTGCVIKGNVELQRLQAGNSDVLILMATALVHLDGSALC